MITFRLLPNSRPRVLHRLSAFFSLVLFSSCAQQHGPVPVRGHQGLRISTSETYAVSVGCECKAAGACDTEAIERLFTAGLRERGIRLVSHKKATRTLTLKCRKVAPPARNELPLAPGSRLWYQRRIFAPTASRSGGNRSAEGPLQMEIVVRSAQPMNDHVPLGEFKATRVIAGTSEIAFRTAIDFLITAIQ